MTRQDYWVAVVLLFVGTFVVYFVFGFTQGYIPPGIDAIIQGATVIFLWMIGYRRCQDAGVHVAWCIFTPIVIGMIWLGCLRSKVTV